MLARRDLAAMHEALLENHPGPVDRLNPQYRDWLEGGYVQALALADSVESLDGLIAVLSFYTSGFDDGHLAWGSSFERGQEIWPGFVVALRDGRFLIDHVAPWAATDAVAPGTEVLDCDGESLADRLVEEVMPFHEGIETLEASRVRLAPRVLIDDMNPFVSRPHECEMSVDSATAPTEVELTWRWIDRDELDSLVSAAAYGPGTGTYRILHPADDVVWITIPSFADNVADHEAGLKRVVAAMPDARDAGLVVFDVRGNRGGNSAWARRILGPLFGEDYMERVETAVGGDQYVEWRASAGNADFIEQFTLPRFESDAESYAWFEKLVAALREGARTGKELVRVPDDTSESGVVSAPLEQLPLARHVILLTDGWCASACLDFADRLLAIPGVRHAGAPTFADAVYIDNRGIGLPSKLGWFTFSMKVYRNRPRANNQPYIPDLPYTGTGWDLESLEAWLLRAAR